MGSSRRDFLASVGGFASIPILDSLYADTKIRSPLADLEPVDTQLHAVEHLPIANAYEVSLYWKPYASMAATEYTIRMPENIVEKSFGDVIRNPLEVYRKSLTTDFTTSTATNIEKHLQVLATLNSKRLSDEDASEKVAQSLDDFTTTLFTKENVPENTEKQESKTDIPEISQTGVPPYVAQESPTLQTLNPKNRFISPVRLSLRKSLIRKRIRQNRRLLKHKRIGRDKISLTTNETDDSHQKPEARKQHLEQRKSELKSYEPPSQAEEDSTKKEMSEENVETAIVGTSWKKYLIPQAVRFVQQLEYKKDYTRNLPLDYPQYPAETLYLGVGDCEDSSILLATLLESFNTLDIRTGLAVPPGHMGVVAAIPDLPHEEKYEQYTEIDGIPYTYFETTNISQIYKNPPLSENPLFIYTDGQYKNMNPQTFPASFRRAVQIGKNGILNLFSAGR